MSATVDPSEEEIALTITTAGELKTSVRNVAQHAKDALKGAHSEIVGSIPLMKFYNDPEGHPEILNDPLYDKYVILRREFAASYLAALLAKNANKSKELYETAKMKLEKFVTDYNNMILSGSDTGIEGAQTTIATVSSKKKTFPANENGEIFRSSTVKGSFFNHKPNF